MARTKLHILNAMTTSDLAAMVQRLEGEVDTLNDTIVAQNKWYSSHTVHMFVQNMNKMVAWAMTFGSAAEWDYYAELMSTFPGQPIEYYRAKFIARYRSNGWTR